MAILIFAISVLSLLYSYVGWKLLIPLNLAQPWKLIFWILLIVIAMLPLISIALRFNRVESVVNDIVAWLGYVSLGFVSLLFFFLLIKDMAWLAMQAFQKVSSLVHPLQPGDGSGIVTELENRRQFLWSSLNYAILAFTGILTGVGYIQARHRIKLVKVTIPFPDLPTELEGLRIIQISDIHVGPTIKKPYVREIVERVNQLNPDIIVLTGDLVDGSVDYLTDDVQPLIDLQSKFGKFFITGNHEYYSGVHQWLTKVKQLGFDVLINEHRVLSNISPELILGGVTDISAGQMVSSHRSDPIGSLAGAPPAKVKILLAHQPISVYQASKAGYDLQLSGHTHGGQYFPFSKLVKLQQPFLAGLYRHENTWVYVNRGTGYWGPPMRIGAPAEITEVRLSGKITEPVEEMV